MSPTNKYHSDSDLPMEEMAVFREPPFDPEDTSPTGVLRRETYRTNPRLTTDRNRSNRGMLWLNRLILGAALLITLIAGVIYIQPSTQTVPKSNDPAILLPSASPTNVATSTPLLPLPSAVETTDTAVPPDVVAELLMQPGDTAPPPDRLYRQHTAYTIAPPRSRPTLISYTIQPGDTLDKIATRFGISTDTIVWANDDIYVNRLLPGDQLTILPESGVLHKTQSDETIQSIADKYKVSPYVIIDSDYNNLQRARPDTLLPTGFKVIIPGGTSAKKAVYWNPGTTFRPAKAAVTGGSGASINANGEVSFGGGPGSCGYQPNSGGGPLRVPLGSYQVKQGFYAGHSAIDLAAPTGTPVFAAANGTVIFAGWSNWGYGYSVVLAHGNLLTLYAHMSRINVRCGQFVNAGTPVGAVGSTGNSSGP